MKWILPLLICCISATAVAQNKAVTDEGEVVILNSNGTWHYEKKDLVKWTPLELNPADFKKPENSSFQLKSRKNRSVFWIDPKKWSFKKSSGVSDPSEYTFQMKSSDVHGMAITEQIEVDVVELTRIAYSNAKEAAPDVRITKQEYRMVNGNKVIYMEMAGTIQSIKFTYLGYYYSDESGATQFLTYTGTKIVDKHREDIENFLNGLSHKK